MNKYSLSHLKELEAESIHIIREAVSESKNPVMLYSVGKDSSVMLHLAQKAFYPALIPFPLMHIDTGFKFPEMYEFRDKMVSHAKAELIVSSSAEKGTANPYELGNDKCCQILKTRALLDGISNNEFDLAFGGARREEEKSRAKERIFSFRDKYGQWNPKTQKPELWNLYNARKNEKESVRVFPLSNWTECDIWEYIKYEDIPVVPLYFAKTRKVIRKGNILLPVEYEHSPKIDGTVENLECRFRSLGCIPCTGAVLSSARTLDEIISEVKDAKRSERENRVIDLTSESSMETKKKEGYF